MSQFADWEDHRLEAEKQRLRKQKRELEPEVLKFARRLSGTRRTEQPRLTGPLRPDQKRIWDRYLALGNAAIVLENEQRRRKQERRIHDVPGFDYWREYARLANGFLTASQVDYIRDILDIRQDVEDAKVKEGA